MLGEHIATATNRIARGWLWIVTILLVSLLVPAVSTTAQAATVAEKFRQAQKAHDAGDCETALPILEDVLKETKSPNARLYIARCMEKLGNLDEAYEQYQLTLSEATRRAPKEPKYNPTRNSAASELALLKPKIGLLVVAVPTSIDGITVYVDESPVPNDRRDRAFAVMPGDHTIRAEAPGRETFTEKVFVPANQTKSVAVTMGESDVSGGGGEIPGDTSSGGGIRTAGFVVAGVGAASIVVFAVTAVMAKSRHDQLADECGGVRCTDPTYADVVDEGETLQTIANISLIAGGVLVAGGVLMIALGGPSDGADSEPANEDAFITDLRPNLAVVPGAAYIGLSGRF